MIWRNQPALTSVGLFDTNGDPVTNPDGSQVQVPVSLKKTDSFFTLALVMKL